MSSPLNEYARQLIKQAGNCRYDTSSDGKRNRNRCGSNANSSSPNRDCACGNGTDGSTRTRRDCGSSCTDFIRSGDFFRKLVASQTYC